MRALTYPLRHLSIRVSWHDNGWSGTVCKQPRQNTACLKQVNIAESKVEKDEEELHSQSLQGMDLARFPPCVKKRGAFAAPFPLDRFHQPAVIRKARQEARVDENNSFGLTMNTVANSQRS